MMWCKVISKSEIITYNRKKYTKFDTEEQILMRNGEKGIIRHVVYECGCNEYFPGDIILIPNERHFINNENKIVIECSYIRSTRAMKMMKDENRLTAAVENERRDVQCTHP